MVRPRRCRQYFPACRPKWWQPACCLLLLSGPCPCGRRLVLGQGPAIGGAPDRRECIATERRQPTFRAGIEIRSHKGWKTYWRYPGDSGVPPRFSTSCARENVKAIAVKWPAPHRFSDDGGQSIGYKDHVILPLSVVPVDPGKPVDAPSRSRLCDLRKAVRAGGGQGRARARAWPNRHDAALAAAEARVPKRSRGGRIRRRLAITRGAARSRLAAVIVDVTRPAHADRSTCSPKVRPPEWALPLPERGRRRAGRRQALLLRARRAAARRAPPPAPRSPSRPWPQAAIEATTGSTSHVPGSTERVSHLSPEPMR